MSNTTSSNKKANATSSTKSADGNTNGRKYRRNTEKHSYIKVVDKEEETHHTFMVKYYNDKIDTTVTHTESVVHEWIDKVYQSFFKKLGNLVVGLDIKRVGNTKVDDVLQLSVGHRCLIFQFFGCDKDEVPESLVYFLNDPNITFVGAGIDRVAEKLLVDYGLSISKTEDLGRLADKKLRTRGLYQAKLNSLVNIVLGKHLHHEPKFTEIAFSEWDKDTLENEQVEHACLDAYASLKLGLYLYLPQPQKKVNKATAINPGAI